MDVTDLSQYRHHFAQILSDVSHLASERSIVEHSSVSIGGIDQYVEIRGQDVDKPLLLFIHGGPGQPEIPTSWLYQRVWEEYFVVVQWDQRGCGKSLPDDMSTFDPEQITIERMIDDGEEVVDHLLHRFNRTKLFVVGHSWGTVIGLRLAERRPESIFAYVGIGQVINSVENETVSYDFVEEQAARTENAEAMAELAEIAPYPPSHETFSVSNVLIERKWVNHFGGMVHGRDSSTHLDNAALLSPTYSNEDFERAPDSLGSILQLLPQLLSFDATDLTRLECPVFLFAGRHDYATPSQVSSAWFERLNAPQKLLVWFERSAHMIHYEEPGKVFVTLVTEVLPLAR